MVKYKYNILLFFYLLSTVLICSCSTSSLSTVQLDKPGRVASLDANFEILARLGNTPVGLVSKDAVARYAIKSSGLPTEFVVILNPAAVSEPLIIPTSGTQTLVESVISYHDYLDALLRSHRNLLAGDYDEATSIIEKMDHQYEETYGTLVLGATISLLKGNKKESAKRFKEAKSLYTLSESLNNFLEKTQEN